ncbi:MAG TPA: alkaline phosphatase family protein, partial [Pyrinomonadaceae bacterium]
IQSAQHRGLFEFFNAPTRLLSPFPTMTNVALSAMLGASPPAGYESLYFDRKSRQLQGGIRKYLGRRTPDKIPSSYMDDLDYQEPLMFEFLIYVAADTVWRSDMQRFRERFHAAPQNRDYFAFLKATDGLLHSQGPRRLAIALESLDSILKEIRKICGDETEIVLFSDHGMNLEENKRTNLVTNLRSHGFEVRSSFNGGTTRSVCIPAFGLCSYAAAYCSSEELVPSVAAALIDEPGVDFVVYRDGTEVMVTSRQGEARIQKRETPETKAKWYRYDPTTGDPLKLNPIAASLKDHVASDGFAPDSVWYSMTKPHEYPDALNNIYSSLFLPRVKHTADILISLRDGYYYGWSPFGKFVRLAATHGNALRSSTNAFLMSTHRTLPEFVRADDARELLRG